MRKVWVKPQDDISLGFAMNISNEVDRTFLISNTFRPQDREAAEQQLSIMRKVRPIFFGHTGCEARSAGLKRMQTPLRRRWIPSAMR